MGLQQVVERYHLAADEFSRGNAEPVHAMFSHRDDVTLANPFGPAVRGWRQVPDALDRLIEIRDGEVTDFETIATYVTPASSCIVTPIQ